jgi:hypothetical protein
MTGRVMMQIPAASRLAASAADADLGNAELP